MQQNKLRRCRRETPQHYAAHHSPEATTTIKTISWCVPSRFLSVYALSLWPAIVGTKDKWCSTQKFWLPLMLEVLDQWLLGTCFWAASHTERSHQSPRELSVSQWSCCCCPVLHHSRPKLQQDRDANDLRRSTIKLQAKIHLCSMSEAPVSVALQDYIDSIPLYLSDIIPLKDTFLCCASAHQMSCPVSTWLFSAFLCPMSVHTGSQQ